MRGIRVFSPFFTAVFYNNAKHTKVAVVVSKKLAKTAVVRNKLRRRVYEAVAGQVITGKPYSVVIYPTGESKKASFQDLKSELERAFHQVK